jgi:Ca2+-binding RTX toxin-like protein
MDYPGTDDSELVDAAGYDRLILLRGNDTVLGARPGMVIDGGAGVDRVVVAQSALIGPVDVTLGDLSVSQVVAGLTLVSVEHFDWALSDGNDRFTGIDGGTYVLYGGRRNDSLTGASGNDILGGGNGLDRLFGGGGDDRLFGGAHADRLYGGSGHDLLVSRLGYDSLFGGVGDDRLFGGRWTDNLFGGEGDDLLVAGADKEGRFEETTNSSQRLDGGEGDDSLFGGGWLDDLYGGDGDDLLVGGADTQYFWLSAGADRVFGGAGDDEFFGSDPIEGGRIDGGAGTDRARINLDQGNFTVTGGSATLSNGTLLTSIEHWFLWIGRTFQPLRWTTGDGYDTLFGSDGDDRLDGRGGNDIVYGAGGADTLIGGAGDDVVDAGVAYGDVVATGGAGADTFVFNDPATGAAARITDFQRGTDLLGFRFEFEGADLVAAARPEATGETATILFDTDTGALSFDIDGTGGEAAVFLVTLEGVTGLGYGDLIFS